jgi:antitoxin component YwqK of YwqJK toxin-antitoxin module
MATAVEMNVAAVAVADAVCVICHEEESAEQPFLNPGPCACIGSLRYHRECLVLTLKYSGTCGACQKPYTNPNLIGAVTRQLDKTNKEDMMGIARLYFSQIYARPYDFFEVAQQDDQGRRHGYSAVYVRFYHYGWTRYRVAAIREFKNGLVHGESITYSSEGAASDTPTTAPPPASNRAILETYVDGVRMGPFQTFHPNGELRSSGTYRVEGKRVGLYEEFTSDGEILQRVTFAEDGTESYTDGQQIFYYPYRDQGYKFHGVIEVTYKGGKKNGLAVAKDDADDILEILTYKDDKLHGAFTRYEKGRHLHGKQRSIEASGAYKNGQRHGKFIINNNNGRFLELNYSEGLPVGTQKVYGLEPDHRNILYTEHLLEMTTLAADGSGLLDGPAIYYRHGKVTQISNYSRGQLHGRLALFDERGVKRWEILMDRGLVKGGSIIRCADESGVEATSRAAAEGELLGGVIGDFPLRFVYNTRTHTHQMIELFEPEPLPLFVRKRIIGCICGKCKAWYADSDGDYSDDDSYGYYDRD